MIFQYFCCLLIIFATTTAEHYSGDFEVYEGQPFSIECSGLKAADSTQEDVVYWTRDKMPFTSFETGKVRVSRPNSTSSRLYVAEASKGQEGTYRCLRNAVSSWNLTVKIPKKIITVYAQLGKPWNIVCQNLQPRQKINWLKNWTKIEELTTGEIQVINTCKGSILQSDSARLEHMGYYVCTSDGQEIFSLRPMEKIKYWGTRSVWENDDWSIFCNNVQPSLNKINWTKNGEEIPELASGQIHVSKISATGSKLYSAKAKYQHAGKYSCAQFGNDSFYLQVKQVTYRVKPRDVILEGQPWSIECNVKPGDCISWSRNGNKIPELQTGEMEVINIKNRTSILKSKFASMSHEGFYTCTTRSQNFYHLSIQKAKKIKVLNQEASLDLECVNASKTDQIQWQKNGQPMNNVDQVLTLQHTNESVYGYYTCHAKDKINVWSYFHVVPPLGVHLPRAAAVLIGEDFQTTCSGNFWPEVQIKWEFGNETYTESEDNVKLSRDEKNGIDNAVITIKNVQNDGRKHLKCMAAYDWSDNSQITKASLDLLVSSL